MESEFELTVAPVEQIAFAMEKIRFNVEQMVAPFQASIEKAAAMVGAFVDVQENIRRSIERRIAPIRASIDQAAILAFVEVEESIRRNTERWFALRQAAADRITERMNFSMAQMAGMMAAAAANFERYLNEEAPETCTLLCQAGWVGMDRHFSNRTVARISTAAQDRGRSGDE